MKASDIMTSPVITVGPETPVGEIAAVLLARQISALPVLEKGRLIGMVSEADLVHRHEIGTDRIAPGPWWLRLFGADRSPAQYVKSHAGKARAMERIARIRTPILHLGRDCDHLQGIFQLAHAWMREAGKDSTWVSFDHPEHGYPFIYRAPDGTFRPDPVQAEAFAVIMAFFDRHLRRAT